MLPDVSNVSSRRKKREYTNLTVQRPGRGQTSDYQTVRVPDAQKCISVLRIEFIRKSGRQGW
jgi:hypothetical protein